DPSLHSEAGFDNRRLSMYQALQHVLGPTAADTLMIHLPPSGWGDVARRSEVNQKFADVDRRFTDVEIRLGRIEAQLEGLASMKRYVIGTGISLAGLICAFGIPLTIAVLRQGLS
ncbi:MAG: hypothetical protein RIS39_1009, partial [Actinomycetota bacterium]